MALAGIPYPLNNNNPGTSGNRVRGEGEKRRRLIYDLSLFVLPSSFCFLVQGYTCTMCYINAFVTLMTNVKLNECEVWPKGLGVPVED